MSDEVEHRKDVRTFAEDIAYRREIVERMVCPDCGSELRFVSAREMMHPGHAAHHLARKCTGPDCPFICWQGDEGARPVTPITPGTP